MNEIDLLPCPFCGRDSMDFFKDGTGWHIGCSNCGASTRWDSTKLAASRWWNRRDTLAQWIKANERIPSHQQDCVVISDSGAVRRAIFWKTPEDAAGIWYLDAFHRVIVTNVVLWMPFPVVDSRPITLECPSGCQRHTYYPANRERRAMFCEYCGALLKQAKDE